MRSNSLAYLEDRPFVELLMAVPYYYALVIALLFSICARKTLDLNAPPTLM